MTIQQIRDAVQEVWDLRGDAERAHAKEDHLHQAVLKVIADGDPNARALAFEALKTLAFEFDRWCA